METRKLDQSCFNLYEAKVVYRFFDQPLYNVILNHGLSEETMKSVVLGKIAEEIKRLQILSDKLVGAESQDLESVVDGFKGYLGSFGKTVETEYASDREHFFSPFSGDTQMNDKAILDWLHAIYLRSQSQDSRPSRANHSK